MPLFSLGRTVVVVVDVADQHRLAIARDPAGDAFAIGVSAARFGERQHVSDVARPAARDAACCAFSSHRQISPASAGISLRDNRQQRLQHRLDAQAGVDRFADFVDDA